jgi:hypothetical protein
MQGPIRSAVVRLSEPTSLLAPDFLTFWPFALCPLSFAFCPLIPDNL